MFEHISTKRRRLSPNSTWLSVSKSCFLSLCGPFMIAVVSFARTSCGHKDVSCDDSSLSISRSILSIQSQKDSFLAASPPVPTRGLQNLLSELDKKFARSLAGAKSRNRKSTWFVKMSSESDDIFTNGLTHG